MKLKDKAIVVTGGAQGLGRACAERFIADGAYALITDIKEDVLVETAKQIGVAHVAADVSKRADVERVVQTCVDRFGKIDVILNNAGIVKNQDFLSISDDDYDAVLNVNLRGTFLGVQTAGKQMVEQGHGGVIINMSSINAILANPAIATYSMSKGGMNMLTSVASVALAPHGIRVVGIGPGTIATEMVKQAIFTSDEAHNTVLSRTPAGRCGEPDEIASVASFLASDDASYITGQTIYPDGGRLVLNYTVPVDES